MTIQAEGHVVKMEGGTANDIRLTIYIGGKHGGHEITIEAAKSELAGQYLPGTPVQVTVIPRVPTAYP